MPYCVPVCKGCREAGTCPKGEVPASAYAPLPRSQPRRAAVQATYPRDVRPVYVHLACGHLTTKEAQVFFSVWRGKGSADLYCETCHAWVAVAVREVPRPEAMF